MAWGFDWSAGKDMNTGSATNDSSFGDASLQGNVNASGGGIPPFPEFLIDTDKQLLSNLPLIFMVGLAFYIVKKRF